MTDNGGNDVYHSAQIEFTRPIARGFQFHGGWVWASQITDVEESSYLGVVGVDPYKRAYNYGPSITYLRSASSLTSFGSFL